VTSERVMAPAACLRLAIACALFAGTASARAQAVIIYGGYGGRALVVTDRPAPGLRVITGLHGRLPPSRMRMRYAAEVRNAAASQGLDPLLVHAVIGAESGYDPRAVSAKGAAGLMQLMPETARRYGVADRFAVDQNLDAGTRYLRDLLAHFAGNRRLALAAYNAGEDAVARAGFRVPPIPETQDYVERVERRYRALAHAARQ